MDQVKQIEYDYEHWNQHSGIKNAQKLMLSPLYKELPINAKFILYYCQLFFITEWNFFDLGPEFFNLIDKFEIEFNINRIEEPKYQLFYFLIKIQILFYNEEYNQIKAIKSHCDKLVLDLNAIIDYDVEVKKILGLFYLFCSKIFIMTGNPKEKLNLILKSYENWKQLDCYYYRFKCIMEASIMFRLTSKWKEGIQLLKNNYDYYKKEQNANPLYKNYLLFEISLYYGIMLEFSGSIDITTALKYIEKALEGLNNYTSEDEKELYLRLKYSAYHTKGYILELMGDTKGSIELYKISVQDLKQLEQLFNQISIIYLGYLGDLGEAIANTDDLKLALEYQLKALNLKNKALKSKLGHMFSRNEILAESYYQLIHLYIQLKNLDKGKAYLAKFDNLIKKDPKSGKIKRIIIQYKLARGLIYKNSNSFEDIGKAKSILLEIINDNVRFEMMADALVPLIDIMVQEYKMFQEQKNFQEIMSLLSRLEKFSEENNSNTLKIYAILLGGKIELIQGNIGKAEELYRKSLSIAEKFKNTDLINKSQIELQKLQKDLGNWEKIVRNTSIKERFELLDLEDYIKEGKKYITIK